MLSKIVLNTLYPRKWFSLQGINHYTLNSFSQLINNDGIDNSKQISQNNCDDIFAQEFNILSEDIDENNENFLDFY